MAAAAAEAEEAEEAAEEEAKASAAVKAAVEAKAGERLCVLQLAAGHLELRAADEAEARGAPAGSVLVFIGEGLDEPWLRLRLTACRAA